MDIYNFLQGNMTQNYQIQEFSFFATTFTTEKKHEPICFVSTHTQSRIKMSVGGHTFSSFQVKSFRIDRK